MENSLPVDQLKDLLSLSGDTHASFKFKDEADWDNQPSANQLVLDTGKLVASLSRCNLLDRLNLQDSVSHAGVSSETFAFLAESRPDQCLTKQIIPPPYERTDTEWTCVGLHSNDIRHPYLINQSSVPTTQDVQAPSREVTNQKDNIDNVIIDNQTKQNVDNYRQQFLNDPNFDKLSTANEKPNEEPSPIKGSNIESIEKKPEAPASLKQKDDIAVECDPLEDWLDDFLS